MGVDLIRSGQGLHVIGQQDVRFIRAGTAEETPADTLKTNLISWWTLDEASGSRADSHGSNDLTDNNTVGSAAGKQGNAADFETNNTEYLSRASNSTLQLGDIDCTFAFWINAESLSGGDIILAKDDASTKREYAFYYKLSTNRLVWQMGDGSNIDAIVEADSLGAPSTGAWYFVVCGHNAADSETFIQVNDGTEDTAADTGTPATTTEAFGIGDTGSGAFGNEWDGLIDEVALWKRILTTEERTWLYNSGNGRTYSNLN